MTTDNAIERAIEALQQLGLKEYEAKCFVGLSRLSKGTAKQLSEITEVPRTRVYDAIRTLEAQGLVEIQHSSPQQFRAGLLEEATEMLRNQYDARVERLIEALQNVERVQPEDETEIQEVWALSGQDPTRTRTRQLVDDATDEVVLVVGDESVLTDELVARPNDANARVDLLSGAVMELLEVRLHEAVPSARTFTSGLAWLESEPGVEKELTIGRLLLVDRSSILVSTLVPDTGEEHAVFGGGFGNGIIVIARRLMAHGLLEPSEPSGD